MATPDPITPGKEPTDSEKHANKAQAEHFDIVAAGEEDNYEGLTATCIIVYLVSSLGCNDATITNRKQAILAVGFAEMMVIVSSGFVRTPGMRYSSIDPR